MIWVILGGLAFLAIVMFTKPGVLIKGAIGLFVKDIAQTPEGAEAIYQEAIEKAQDKYNAASDALQRAVGQLDTAKRKLADAINRKALCENKCKQFLAANREDQAMIYAEERESIINEIDSYQTTVDDLQPIANEAQEICTNLEAQLRKLKTEQKTVVDNLRRNIQVKEMYDQMDELKRNGNLDKMMGYVKDGAQEKREMAVGAKTLHDGKLSTRVTRAENEAKRMSSSDYLASLKSQGGAFEVKERTKN